jgi:hypothetical protein
MNIKEYINKKLEELFNKIIEEKIKNQVNNKIKDDYEQFNKLIKLTNEIVNLIYIKK